MKPLDEIKARVEAFREVGFHSFANELERLIKALEKCREQRDLEVREVTSEPTFVAVQSQYDAELELILKGQP